jgi:hypothetical protein
MRLIFSAEPVGNYEGVPNIQIVMFVAANIRPVNPFVQLELEFDFHAICTVGSTG